MGHGDSLSLDARIEPLTYAEPDALDGPQCPSIEAVREPLDPWWPAHPAPARAGIRGRSLAPWALHARPAVPAPIAAHGPSRDRKSIRLNSSHSQTSYAVFCL